MDEKENAELIAPVISAGLFAKVSRGSLFFRGGVLFLIGLLLIFQPLLTATVLTVGIGLFLIFDAFWALAAAFRGDRSNRGIGIAYSLLTLLLGVLAIASPLMMDYAWILLLGCWQIVAGVNYFLAAWRRETGFRMLAVMNGIIAVFVGVVFVIWPFSGLVAAVWVLGILLIMLSTLLFTAAIATGRAKTA